MQEHEEYTAQIKPQNEILRNIFEILESLVLAIVCVIVTFIFVARLSIVSGSSMEPTLQNKDYLIVADPLFAYSPKSGDVVVLDIEPPEDYYRESDEQQTNGRLVIVKRVIATEGQKIKIRYSDDFYEVYVDGQLLDEPYAYYNPTLHYIGVSNSDMELSIEPGNKGVLVYEGTVPENCVFVMGDNRNNSYDSRSGIGFVDEDLVLGKVVFRLLPLNKIGIIK